MLSSQYSIALRTAAVTRPPVEESITRLDALGYRTARSDNGRYILTQRSWPVAEARSYTVGSLRASVAERWPYDGGSTLGEGWEPVKVWSRDSGKLLHLIYCGRQEGGAQGGHCGSPGSDEKNFLPIDRLEIKRQVSFWRLKDYREDEVFRVCWDASGNVRALSALDITTDSAWSHHVRNTLIRRANTEQFIWREVESARERDPEAVKAEELYICAAQDEFLRDLPSLHHHFHGPFTPRRFKDLQEFFTANFLSKPDDLSQIVEIEGRTPIVISQFEKIRLVLLFYEGMRPLNRNAPYASASIRYGEKPYHRVRSSDELRLK